jgi:hypothetical protein
MPSIKTLVLISITSAVVGGLFVFVFLNKMTENYNISERANQSLSQFTAQTSLVSNDNLNIDTTLDQSSASTYNQPISQGDLSYPLLVTSRGVYDQSQKEVIHFGKDQNNKNQFFLAGRDLITPESLKDYSLSRSGNDYYTHDGKNLIVVPNGNFTNIKKVDLNKDIVSIKAIDDKIFVNVNNQSLCPIENFGLVNICKFEMYYLDNGNLNNLIYLNSEFGRGINTPSQFPAFLDQSGYWMVTGYGDAGLNNSVYAKFSFAGNYLTGFNLTEGWGDAKLSKISFQEYKNRSPIEGTIGLNIGTEIFYKTCSYRQTGNGGGSDCDNNLKELTEIGEKYIPKEILNQNIDAIDIYYTCENYKIKSRNNYSAEYFYKDSEMGKNGNGPSGKFLGCEEWNFFRNQEGNKNDPGYLYQEKTIKSKNFVFDCNVSGKLTAADCIIKSSKNKEIARFRQFGFPTVSNETESYTEFTFDFLGYGVCSKHKYQIDNKTFEMREIKFYEDCSSN